MFNTVHYSNSEYHNLITTDEGVFHSKFMDENLINKNKIYRTFSLFENEKSFNIHTKFVDGFSILDEEADVYQLKFSLGSDIYITPYNKLITYDGEGILSWKTIDELKRGDKIAFGLPECNDIDKQLITRIKVNEDNIFEKLRECKSRKEQISYIINYIIHHCCPIQNSSEIFVKLPIKDIDFGEKIYKYCIGNGLFGFLYFDAIVFYGHSACVIHQYMDRFVTNLKSSYRPIEFMSLEFNPLYVGKSNMYSFYVPNRYHYISNGVILS